MEWPCSAESASGADTLYGYHYDDASLIRIKVGDLTPITLDYDAPGKLKVVQQGGYGWRYFYNGAGRVEAMGDTLRQTTTSCSR
jgi:YD repeat-containing protein